MIPGLFLRNQFAVLVFSFVFQTSGLAIEVDNLRDGVTVNYGLLVLKGRTSGHEKEVAVTLNRVHTRPFAVVDKSFIALVELAHGANHIELRAGSESKSYKVTFAKSTNANVVRLVYIVPTDSDGSIQAPPLTPTSAETAQRRLVVAGKMIQSVIAEAFVFAGEGRKTVNLKSDSAGNVMVDVHRSALTTRQMHEMGGEALWKHFYDELSRYPQRETTKDIAVISATRYRNGSVKAHTALGGGYLGLFGSGNMYSWATTVEAIGPAFLDARRVNKDEVFDDSSHRGTFWANFATGAGAVLHELGHCLGLPHPPEPVSSAIMWRGFDHLDQMFVLRPGAQEISNAPLQWLPSDRVALHASPWISAN